MLRSDSLAMPHIPCPEVHPLPAAAPTPDQSKPPRTALVTCRQTAADHEASTLPNMHPDQALLHVAGQTEHHHSNMTQLPSQVNLRFQYNISMAPYTTSSNMTEESSLDALFAGHDARASERVVHPGNKAVRMQSG